MGVVAYPGYGICKSLHTLTHTHTRKSIAAARTVEAQYLMENLGQDDVDADAILQNFDQLSTQRSRITFLQNVRWNLGYPH